MTATVAVSGLAVLDFVFRLPEMPDRPEKFRADGMETIGGGGGANAAVAIQRLGGRAVLSAHIGGDGIGAMIRDGLEAEGVDCRGLVIAKEGRSSCSSILIDADGERQIVNFRGTDLDLSPAPPDFPFDAVMVDTRRTEAALAHLAAARAAGKPGVVDAEAPVDPRFLDIASHLAFSEQGLRDFTGTEDPEAGLRALESSAWAAVTLGGDGVVYRDGDQIGHVPAPKITAVDTLGAGDVWHGAFTLRLAEGATEVEAIRFANAAAALKCTRTGVRAAMPTRHEANDLLRKAQI